MRHIKSFLFAIFAVFLLVPMLHAGDEEDINLMVKEKVSVIFELLGQKDLDKDERNLKIVEELNEIMYFTAAGALSLGKHWKKISKKQKKEFLKIFKKYINNYIVEKIDLYTNQNIDIGEAKIVKKGRAKLNIGILSGGEALQVTFKLRKNKKKAWRVWDVDIEGVSLITTFRSQFSGVLKKNSFDVLLEKLRNPTEQS
ncbi:MAG: ABC transporter substrate-binding protein [Deltaproteobacteria bacterium]|nr:ABC transporter substrate-binding protein [Deltaproteobacteria bacterium]